ncbi:MAG: Tim44 domain-containing protein [Rubrivivax sp.]|nr:Tim44 domain-containing protein [Rubrivivax sp.]
MKTWLIGALMLALSATLVPGDADAKRLGGGKSTGTQRSMPERTSPTATPPAQSPAAAPGQQAAAPATAAAPTAAAAAGKRSWMGPIAGLAAGLGIAALMSHLGLGEAFGNFLMMALLVVAVIALVAFIRRRMAGGAARQPALAGVGAGAGSSTQVAWPSAAPAAGAETAPMQRQAEPAFGNATPASATAPASGAAAASAAPVAAAFVPAAFDSEGFERVAKAIFIRLQAANDAANLDDLRQFTTPEMFAELKVDLLERGAAAQATEVKSVEARVIDVAEEGERQVVSVRYRGEVVEAAGAAAEKFDEVWHLVRQSGSQGGWTIAGIEQMPG